MLHESDSSNPNPQPGWSEHRVERLLGWFFAQEVPGELRDGDSVPKFQPVRVSVAAPLAKRTGASVGRWLLPLCALALVGSVWSLQSLPPRTIPLLAALELPRGVEFEATSLPVMTEQFSYAGSHGSFAQRSELRWTSESYFEPSSGVWVEWSAPELVIDVESTGDTEGAAQ